MHHTITTKGDRAYATIIGDGDSKVAMQFVADAEKVFGEHPGVLFDVIVDMRKSGTSDYAGIKNFLRNAPLRNIAFIVTDDVVKALIQVAVPQREEKTEYFENIQEAEEWLDSFGK